MSSVAFSNCWIRGMVLGKVASGPSSVRRKVTGDSPPGHGASARERPEKTLRPVAGVGLKLLLGRPLGEARVKSGTWASTSVEVQVGWRVARPWQGRGGGEHGELAGS